MAALKGIDLDEGSSSSKDKFDEIQRRVEAKLNGGSEQQMEMDAFGIDIETEGD